MLAVGILPEQWQYTWWWHQGCREHLVLVIRLIGSRKPVRDVIVCIFHDQFILYLDMLKVESLCNNR
jgi:hypothetical protein